jgi:hypothetical protein
VELATYLVKLGWVLKHKGVLNQQHSAVLMAPSPLTHFNQVGLVKNQIIYKQAMHNSFNLIWQLVTIPRHFPFLFKIQGATLFCVNHEKII